MKPDHDPAVVSLETHRRRRIAETKARAKADALRARNAQSIQNGVAPREKAINWRRAPMALAAIVLFLALSWLVRLISG